MSGGRLLGESRGALRWQRQCHVERKQLLHQLGGGCVCGVCGAHLLGHVRYRLHPSVLWRRQLHPALSGPAAQAAGEGRGKVPKRAPPGRVLPHTAVTLVRDGMRVPSVAPTTDVTVQCCDEVAIGHTESPVL